MGLFVHRALQARTFRKGWVNLYRGMGHEHYSRAGGGGGGYSLLTRVSPRVRQTKEKHFSRSVDYDSISDSYRKGSRVVTPRE